jgi:uncharacterized membrane protein (DUF485 family)
MQASGADARANHVGSGWLGVWLTALLFFPVAGFFAFAAFSPGSLGFALIPSQPITAWYAYGLGLIFYSVALGFLYAVITNRAADRAGANWSRRAAGTGLVAIGVLIATAGGADAALASGEAAGMN